MENFEGPSSIRNVMFNGKNYLLPPKSPFPSISPSHIGYNTPSFAHKGIPNPRDGSSRHERTSSESFLLEEQPSWLDDLLNEPDTPVRRGHRRSSSDSFAYLGAPNVANLEYMVHCDDNKFGNTMHIPTWNHNSSNKHKNWTSDASPNRIMHPHGIHYPKENHIVQNSGLPEGDTAQSPATDKKDSHVKNSSETDQKHSKQHFAQRSRVRKLQYIGELERNLLALQVEGSEASAELEFLNQQNLIMNMENKALKQRLESLTQEHLIKYLEHEMLQKERERLRTLYQQQQQKQRSNGLRRTTSRDLDQQLANLSLKSKDS